jgi:hypothetical protein
VLENVGSFRYPATIKGPGLQHLRVIEALGHAFEAGLMGVVSLKPFSVERSGPVPGMRRASELQKDSMEAQNEPDSFRGVDSPGAVPVHRSRRRVLKIGV